MADGRGDGKCTESKQAKQEDIYPSLVKLWTNSYSNDNGWDLICLQHTSILQTGFQAPYLGARKGTLDLDHERWVQPHGPERSRKTTNWGALQSGRTLIWESECCCLSPSVVFTKYQICPWTSVPLSVKGASSFLPGLLWGVNWDDEYMQNSSGNCNALIQIAVIKTTWGPWRT